MKLLWWRSDKDDTAEEIVEPLPGSREARALARDLHRVRNEVDLETERLRAGVNSNNIPPPF
jgi:hypothetical protein